VGRNNALYCLLCRTMGLLDGGSQAVAKGRQFSLKRAKLMSSYQFLRGLSTQNEKTKVATLGFRSFTYH